MSTESPARRRSDGHVRGGRGGNRSFRGSMSSKGDTSFHGRGGPSPRGNAPGRFTPRGTNSNFTPRGKGRGAFSEGRNNRNYDKSSRGSRNSFGGAPGKRRTFEDSDDAKPLKKLKFNDDDDDDEEEEKVVAESAGKNSLAKKGKGQKKAGEMQKKVEVKDSCSKGQSSAKDKDLGTKKNAVIKTDGNGNIGKKKGSILKKSSSQEENVSVKGLKKSTKMQLKIEQGKSAKRANKKIRGKKVEVEDDKDEDEDQVEDEDEDEEMDGEEEEEVDDDDEDEDEEEEVLEDESDDEEAAVVPPKPLKITSTTPVGKSALKTPNTAKTNKKVDISKPATPATSTKTPATPHPMKKTPGSEKKLVQQLKFDDDEDEDEEDEEDEDEGDEEEDEEDDDEEEDEEDDDDEEDEEDGDEEDEEDEGDEEEDEDEEDEKVDEKVVEELKAKVNKVKSEKRKDSAKMKEKVSAEAKRKVDGLTGGLTKQQKNKTETKQELLSRQLKRKSDEVVSSPSKVLKVDAMKEVINEEERRKDERNRKSLFLRGFKKSLKDSDLKALHPDIISVRRPGRKNYAWLIFPTEEQCTKGYEHISKAKIDGHTLFVDYCGTRSKSVKKVESGQKPINPLELYVSGFPPNTSRDVIKVIFRSATNIVFPKQHSAKKACCFVKFDDEKQAKAAFEKGKALRIGGVPVDVLYARIDSKMIKKDEGSVVSQKEVVRDTTEKKDAQKKGLVKSKKQVVDDDDDDDDDDDIESSNEGIEEVEEAGLKKSKNAKVVDEDEEEEDEDDEDEDEDEEEDEEDEDEEDDDDE